MTVRVAVAGAGYFSRFHVDAWARLGAQVVGIAALERDLARDRARALPGCSGFDDVGVMLAETEPDLVDIVTPPETHLGLIETALGAGIATVCQKPFCGGLAGAEQAARLAAETGVPLIVHENFRFQPWYAEIGRRLADGDLGPLYAATFRLRPGDGQGADAYLARQPYFQTMPRFLVHETLVHLIDVFRFLFGEVRWVMADLRRLNPAIRGEDAGLIVLGFDDGVRGVIDGNRLVDHAARNRRLVMGEMWVEGARGTLRLDGDGGLHRRAHGDNAEEPCTYAWDDRGYGGDCVYRLQAHVLDALAGRMPAVNAAADYLANLRVVEAVYRAADDGRRIDLPGQPPN